MSEYQYYEFQAIDRPLGEADRQTLRALSARARITATSFTNSYEWGDFKGDPHVAAAIRLARSQAAAEKLAAERKRQAEEAEKARQARLAAIARRGEGVWREVDAEIARRNPAGYHKAAGLLLDLQALTEDRGATPDFKKRLSAIRERHAGKGRFIERLAKIGWSEAPSRGAGGLGPATTGAASAPSCPPASRLNRAR